MEHAKKMVAGLLRPEVHPEGYWREKAKAVSCDVQFPPDEMELVAGTHIGEDLLRAKYPETVEAEAEYGHEQMRLVRKRFRQLLHPEDETERLHMSGDTLVRLLATLSISLACYQGVEEYNLIQKVRRRLQRHLHELELGDYRVHFEVPGVIEILNLPN